MPIPGHNITTREVLCEVLKAYTPRTWWQALLKALLLGSCAKTAE